ncbi:hypothetical protein IAR50_004354 [Cryptococcus sp. DSM 104548]
MSSSSNPSQQQEFWTNEDFWPGTDVPRLTDDPTADWATQQTWRVTHDTAAQENTRDDSSIRNYHKRGDTVDLSDRERYLVRLQRKKTIQSKINKLMGEREDYNFNKLSRTGIRELESRLQSLQSQKSHPYNDGSNATAEGEGDIASGSKQDEPDDDQEEDNEDSPPILQALEEGEEYLTFQDDEEGDDTLQRELTPSVYLP